MYQWLRNIAENFSRLSMVHERYRQTDYRQTDGRRHIANMTWVHVRKKTEMLFVTKKVVYKVCNLPIFGKLRSTEIQWNRTGLRDPCSNFSPGGGNANPLSSFHSPTSHRILANPKNGVWQKWETRSPIPLRSYSLRATDHNQTLPRLEVSQI